MKERLNQRITWPKRARLALASLATALLLAAPALHAQDAPPITYVDATHGSGGNTTMPDGSDWHPEPANTPNNAGGVWAIRSPFANNGLVYQSPFDSDGHRIVTSVSGLPEDTYNVYVYFWSDQAAWRIRASLTNDEELPLFIRGDPGVVQFYTGADATVFSSALEGENPFTTDVMVGEGNRRLHQAHVGTFTGTEFSVFIADGNINGQENRTWYDGIGYASVGPPPPVQMPLTADFGSVRFIEIVEQMTEEPFQLEPVTEGGSMFFADDNTVTALPAGLAGNLAFKTLNPAEGVLRFGGLETTRINSNLPSNDLQYPLSFGVSINRFDDTINRNKLFGWWVANAENRAEVEIVDGDILRLVWWGGGPNLTVDAPPANAWVHIGVVITAETARLYVDGVQVGALEVAPWGVTADTTVWIGGRHDGSEQSHSGWMKDWVVFDEDIGDAGMQQLATGVLPAGNPLQHFPMNEGEGNIVFDQSGNEVHGNLIGSYVWDNTTAVSDDLEFGIGFITDRDLTVYVALDENMEVPSWISNSYTKSGLTVETTAGNFDLWQRDFSARAHVSLPKIVRAQGENNRWVILSEGPDAITENPEGLFQSLPSSDWSVGNFFRQATTAPGAEFHSTSMLAQVSNFNPDSGFRLASTVRVPRLQEEGDNSIGFLLLGAYGGAAPIRAEWLPRMSGGGSVIRFVDTSNESVLAQEAWTGLVPTRTDNDVGVSSGAVETLFSVGTPIFVEDGESVVFTENFAAGGAGWTSGSDDPATDQWEIGAPSSGPGSAFTGTNVAATILDGPYVTGDPGEQPPETAIFIAWLRSPVIDLSQSVTATLRFQEFMQLDPFSDGANLHHRGTVKALDADSLEELAQLAVYKDDLGAWSERVLDLSGVAGNQIVLEFALVTDGFGFQPGEVLPDGWYIDAIEVTARGIEIVSMPDNLALDGTLYGIATERAGVDDASLNHLQFTVSDRGVSGNNGVTVFVAWDIRASGFEPDWLTQNFDRTDHFVGVDSAAGFHRLWAREYADGAQVTLGGASAAGPGATGLPVGTYNYFVLLGDARTGLETFYTMDATGSWTGNDGTLTFTLTDQNGVTQTVQTVVSGESMDRNSFGVALRHPNGTPPIWEVYSLAMEAFEAPDGLTFEQWVNSIFEPGEIDAGLAHPEATPAGDGVANIIKFALDLAPFEPAPRADLPRLEPDQDHILILVYRERTDIDQTQIEYRPEVSVDLIGNEWDGGPGVITELNRQTIAVNLEEVTVRGELPNGADRGFIRLNVIKHH